MDIKLESEWLPDGEDQWGHRVNAEVYRVENVDPVIAELQAELDSWKATAETFEDFYRKTEVERDELLAASQSMDDMVSTVAKAVGDDTGLMWQKIQRAFLVEIPQLQSELTKARELLRGVCEYADGLLADVNNAWAYAGSTGAKETHKDSDYAEAEAYLAHQSPPAARDPTKQSPNQCDGCQAGIPLEVNQYGTPIQRMGSEGKYPDYMACTAKLYLKD